VGSGLHFLHGSTLSIGGGGGEFFGGIEVWLEGGQQYRLTVLLVQLLMVFMASDKWFHLVK